MFPGPVRHMAEVERGWFRRFAGLDVPKRNQAGADPDAALNGVVADPAVVAEAWAAWGEEITFAEQFTRDHDPRSRARIPCRCRLSILSTTERLCGYMYTTRNSRISKASRRRTSDNGL